MLLLRPFAAHLATADSHEKAFIQTLLELIYNSTVWEMDTFMPRWRYENPLMVNIEHFERIQRCTVN